MTTIRLHCLTTTDTTTEDGIDLIALERVVSNSRPLPALTPAERVVAFELLHAAGLPQDEIAARTGVTENAVRTWVVAAYPPPKRTAPVCPSRSAYRRHKARGETCEPCKAENAAADRRYRLTGTTAAA
jgi:hypothetical protein